MIVRSSCNVTLKQTIRGTNFYTLSWELVSMVRRVAPWHRA